MSKKHHVLLQMPKCSRINLAWLKNILFWINFKTIIKLFINYSFNKEKAEVRDKKRKVGAKEGVKQVLVIINVKQVNLIRNKLLKLWNYLSNNYYSICNLTLDLRTCATDKGVWIELNRLRRVYSDSDSCSYRVSQNRRPFHYAKYGA